MNRFLLMRELSACALFVLGVLCAPRPAHAWKAITHVYLAEEAREEVLRQSGSVPLREVDFWGGRVLGELGTATISPNVQRALRDHPEYFRAGAIGPDAYPDILFGQQVIHPESNKAGGADAWLRLLESQIKTPEELAFYLGFLSHAAGDMFGHTFINHYSGGPFTLSPLDNATKHIVVEGHISNHTPALRGPGAYAIDTARVNTFIHDTMIDARRPRIGGVMNFSSLSGTQILRAATWELTRDTWSTSLPGLFTRLRAGLEDKLEGYYDHVLWLRGKYADSRSRCKWTNPGACAAQIYYKVLLAAYQFIGGISVLYMEAWIKDIDRGLRAWPATSTEIARSLFMKQDRRMDVAGARGAFSQYRHGYLCSMMGAPDIACSIKAGFARLIDEVTQNLAFLSAIRDAFIDAAVTRLTGRSVKEWEELAEATATDVDRHVPANPSTSVELAELMHLRSSPPSFDPDLFAPAYNTRVATQLSFLDTRAQWRSVLAQVGWSPLDPDSMMSMMNFDGQLLRGYIRSLDQSNQWLTPGKMFLARDCGLFARFFMHQTGDRRNKPPAEDWPEATCSELEGLTPAPTPPSCEAFEVDVTLDRPTGAIGGVVKLEWVEPDQRYPVGLPHHMWISPGATSGRFRFTEGPRLHAMVSGTRVVQQGISTAVTTQFCNEGELCLGASCVSRPWITDTYQSNTEAPVDGSVTFRITASDPQNSRLSYAWRATLGTITSQADSTHQSEIVWTPSACVPEGTFVEITMTVTNDLGLSNSTSFILSGTECGPQLQPPHASRGG